MIEIWHLLWIIPLCLSIGMLYSETMLEWNRKCGAIRQIRKKPKGAEESEESLRRAYGNGPPPFDKGGTRDPMSLRNGYGVTRDKNPTFAEQWVNIMNFSGESQTEGDYEESEGDYSAEDMG